ncbi:MAG: WYL domain-containing protein [Prevotella sp.]|nr:WYL domain-containing protein [Prevotella sp.]
MPDTKNYSLRVKVLDRLLRKKEGVTIHEMLEEINGKLEVRGYRPIRTKDTILRDLVEISNVFHVRILKTRDPDDSRHIRYKYESADFSIYESGLTTKQIKELRLVLQSLIRCKGFSELEWLQELCKAMDVPVYNCKEPVLEFDMDISKTSLQNLQGLFFAIVEQKTIEIIYHLKKWVVKKLMIYPYYLKQFGRKWYLMAESLCTPDSVKFFELGRIDSINFLPEQEYKPVGMNIKDYFEDFYGKDRNFKKKKVTIIFKVPWKKARSLIDEPIHDSQDMIYHSRKGAIFSICLVPDADFMRTFLSYGEDITILTDSNLKKGTVNKLK